MELSKNYNPAEIEDKWYGHWMQKGYFKSEPDNREPFTVVIPPPNVTGVLHMGHTLNETVQDILVRRARMSGYNACWVPGSDHASIATEAKVVGMLKEKGIDKNNISREEFLKYAFEWKEKYGNIIYSQIKKLGCSVDWDRTNFTMDDHYYKAVIKVFVDLYNKGLVYRGARMINWDPVAKTALSDEEVEYKEITGKLYYIKYEVSSELSVVSGTASQNFGSPSGDGGREDTTTNYIVIATQRPETIMGDTAVCANPTDERYSHLKGKSVLVPLINKPIPVIFDEYVDKDFGTGILKITPAHDINDYNLGLKHNLPVVDTLNEDGTLSAAAQIYVGEDRFAARKKIVEELKQKGLLVKEEEYQTRLGYSQRTNSVAEPKISTQWFVKMKEMTAPALKAVLDGEIEIHPGEKFLATYKYWLENVKDWCISRQLWWGQQIPAWYDEEGNVFVAESEEKAMKLAISNRQQAKGSSSLTTHNSQLTRDSDVLDTWFSSWLWPIEVFNGITDPDNKDINYYYPTQVLVTGQDIIFFWVARMIMAGMEYKKEKPFSDVYFTGMVRDKQGRKMSKQLGNSPDLLDLIDKYGADAVRFGIMISSPAGNDLLFDEASLEQGRNFNNKIWNALKLVKLWEGRQTENHLSEATDAMILSQLPLNTELGMMPVIPIGLLEEDNFATQWFENRLNEVTIGIESLCKQFRLSEALKIIYSLIWDDFCSWYLEWVKPGFEQPIGESVYHRTVYFFERLMQLLHPFMPFITEEVHHLLKEQKEDLTVKQFEIPGKPDQEILEQGNILKQVITSIRDTRNRNQVKPKDKIKLHIQTGHKHNYTSFEDILSKQVNAESISYTDNAIENSLSVLVNKDKFFIEADQVINSSVQKEQLQKDLEYLKGFLISVEKKLSNERFVKNAKSEVIELERKKKADAETRIKIIEESLSTI
ncbi:MAG TPA: valine--tRNA ligase [Chitinophagaceae bacterium]|nr:valine--tRNA ligase [Chitinophagaceae bacterium]